MEYASSKAATYQHGAAGPHKRAILVLGMHRSGTSAITRVLSLCGATLPQRIMPAALGNETGFWEPSVVSAIDDEILTSAGSSWHDPCGLPRSWFHSDVANAFERRLLSALQEDYGDAPLFIVKDPRICLLLPFWLAILEKFDARPLVVIPIRNPLDVSASLRERDGLAHAQSLLLWLRYFLTAERDTRGLARSFISYEALLGDWRGAVAQIGQDLGVSWPRMSYAAAFEIDDFLSPTLKHYSSGMEELQSKPHIVAWIKVAYSWGMRAANGQAPATGELDAVSTALGTAEQAFAPLLAAKDANFRKLLQDRDDAYGAQTGELETLNLQVADLRSQLARQQDMLDESVAGLTRCAAELAALRGRVAERELELDALRGRVAERDLELDALRGRLARREADVDTLGVQLSEQTRVRAEVEERLAAVYASTSWRLTRGVRVLKRTFFGGPEKSARSSRAS